MNELVFIPQKEDYMPFPHLILRAQFMLECFKLTINLVHRDYLSKRMKAALDKYHKKISKRYLCVMSLDNHAWVWDTNDNLDEMKVIFKHKLQQLKYGESVEFIDLMGELKPIRISNKSIEFWW